MGFLKHLGKSPNRQNSKGEDHSSDDSSSVAQKSLQDGPKPDADHGSQNLSPGRQPGTQCSSAVLEDPKVDGLPLGEQPVHDSSSFPLGEQLAMHIPSDTSGGQGDPEVPSQSEQLKAPNPRGTSENHENDVSSPSGQLEVPEPSGESEGRGSAVSPPIGQSDAPHMSSKSEAAESDNGVWTRFKKTIGIVKAPLLLKVTAVPVRNVVVFGETGTGKSSLINMLSGKEVAEVSDRAVGCTLGNTSYDVDINGNKFKFWDTAGLSEGDFGSIPSETALRHLRDVIRVCGDSGVSLLVYCILGARYRDILKANYDLFAKCICKDSVPVVLVVTALENEEPMEKWWDENKEQFSPGRGFDFRGHACITTILGKGNVFEVQYKKSKDDVRALIGAHCSPDAWVVNPDAAWNDRVTKKIKKYWEEYNTKTKAAKKGVRKRSA